LDNEDVVLIREIESLVEKPYDVTVAGHICLDIIPEISGPEIQRIDDLFKPGKLIQVGAAKISTGGPVSNTGLALAKLGLEVAFMARVGEDPLGKLIFDMLAKDGYADGVHLSKQDRTSYTVAVAPPGIDRIYLHYPGANDQFSSSDLNEQIIEQSRLFHFGYPPLMARCYEDCGETLDRILHIAKSAGATVCLDMALPDPNSAGAKAPWKEILEKVLPHVDIFMPSIEEVLFMLDREVYFETKQRSGNSDVIDHIEPEIYSHLAHDILDMGTQIVVFKTAHRGYYILTDNVECLERIATGPSDLENWSNRELWCPAFRVEKIASATGSGDSSIAGFLAGYLNGQSIEKTLKYANCTGYQNLHALDAVSGIRDWTETTRLIQKGVLPMIDLPMENTNWKWDEEHEVWIGENDKLRIKN